MGNAAVEYVGAVIARKRSVVYICVCVEVEEKQQAAQMLDKQTIKKEKKVVNFVTRTGGGSVPTPSACPWHRLEVTAARTPSSWEARRSPPESREATREPAEKTAQGSERAKAQKSGVRSAARNTGPRGAGREGWCSDTKAWSSWLITFALAQSRVAGRWCNLGIQAHTVWIGETNPTP